MGYWHGQTAMALSTDPDTSTGTAAAVVASARDVMKCPWASAMVRAQRSSLMSITRIDLSSDALMMYRPDG